MRIYEILLIVIMALVTFLLRALPFLLFDHGETPPHFITVLGKLLPPAVMSVLLVYCIRNVSFFSGSHGIPELLAIAAAMGLHARKRNTLLSICVSTLFYMLMIQYLF